MNFRLLLLIHFRLYLTTELIIHRNLHFLTLSCRYLQFIQLTTLQFLKLHIYIIIFIFIIFIWTNIGSLHHYLCLYFSPNLWVCFSFLLLLLLLLLHIKFLLKPTLSHTWFFWTELHFVICIRPFAQEIWIIRTIFNLH